MSKQNPFDNVFETNSEKKGSSYTQKEVFPHTKYKSARVKPEDAQFFKEYAVARDMTIIEAISLARELLEKHDPIKRYTDK